MGSGLATSTGERRKQAPVFVVGCHRSGTNLLYDMLLSSGGFAVYRGILPVYEKLIPHFGSFAKAENRRRAIEMFVHSESFRRTGLEVGPTRERLHGSCQSGGDFIRIIMEGIAQAQGVGRWAVYNPDNLLRMPEIKREIPGALFIHIVRDGRDIALSLSKMGGFTPLPWDRETRSLPATALYWAWMVRRGRGYGQALGGDYLEVRFEELALNAQPALSRLGEFLQHDLDYGHIRDVGLGRLSESNSSFRQDEALKESNPVNRWKDRLSREQIAGLEALVGDCLAEFGYEPTLPQSDRQAQWRDRWMHFAYRNYLDTKLWLKMSTPVGRIASLSDMKMLDSSPEPE